MTGKGGAGSADSPRRHTRQRQSWGLLHWQKIASKDRPGRSRDYSLGLPQIRACTLNASGSSRCGIAVPHTTGSFRGDTLVRHDVLGVVPTPRPQRGTPFAPRGPEGRSPASTATMGHCDSLPSISPHFVSFAWRYHRFVLRFVPVGLRAWLRINLELVSRSPTGSHDGDGKVSQVPVKPV